MSSKGRAERGANRRYWAFISYSHQDRKIGEWLHRSLEAYRVPGYLVGRTTPHGNIPKRIVPVFRDREELPTDSNLSTTIEDALRDSRMLIVVCSPRSAQSHWVNEEILSFKRQGRSDAILSLIVDGEPNASDKRGQVAEECFPEALRYDVGSDGQLTKKRAEPIAADIRPRRDSRGDAKLKLIAGVLGIGFDELKRRDLRRRHRVLAAVASVSLIIALVVIGLMIAAISARFQAAKQRELAVAAQGEAERQRDEVQEQERLVREHLSQRCVTEGWRAYDAGNAHLALLWHVHALRTLHTLGATSDSIRTLENAHRVRIARTLSNLAMLTAVIVPGARVRAPMFSPSGEFLVSYGDSADANRVYCWDVASGVLVQPPKAALQSSQRQRRVMINESIDRYPRPDHSDFEAGRLYVTIQGATFRAFDRESHVPLTTVVDTGDIILDCDVAPKTNLILAGGVHCVRIYNGLTGAQVGKTLECLQLSSACFDFDGNRVVTGEMKRGIAIVWDALTGEPLTPEMSHGASISWVDFSRDGQLILTAGRNNDVLLWNAATGERVGVPLRNSAVTGYAAFSPDGGALVTRSDDNTIRVWNIATVVHHRPPERQPLLMPKRDSNVSHDGSLRAEWDGSAVGNLRIVDTRAGGAHVLVMNAPEGVQGWEFSPDDSFLVAWWGSEFTTGYGRAQVWDTHTGMAVGRLLEHAMGMNHATFSPDGRRVATAAANGEARVWGARTGAPLTPYMIHDEEVEHVAFSPDGRLLATASWDRTARLWDAVTGQAVTPPLFHESEVAAVGFGPDGQALLAAVRPSTRDRGSLGRTDWGIRQVEAPSPRKRDRTVAASPFPASEVRGSEYVNLHPKEWGIGLLWDTHPDERTLDQLEWLAQILSHHRIDSTGAPVPLSREEMRGAWERYRGCPVVSKPTP